MPSVMPRYPVYVPSKGRPARCATVRHLIRDGVPFYLVVEPPEAEAYAARYGAERLLILPFADLGLGAVPARNWIRDHAEASGAARHWQLDDNLNGFRRRFRGERLPCEAGLALRVCEDFTDRYENIALSGLNYTMFLATGVVPVPFHLNVHVYSCTLVNHAMPYRWRGRYNDDTDLCLQALAGGWCTVLLNAFSCDKAWTMTTPGGMTGSYQGDGRLRMARSLERLWPGVVETRRKFQRPQHAIKHAWARFDTPLRRRPDLDLSALPAVDDYGMRLIEAYPSRSPELRAAMAPYLAAAAPHEEEAP